MRAPTCWPTAWAGRASMRQRATSAWLRRTSVATGLSTSPRDMVRLLELIARGQEPSPSSATAMLDLLLAQRVNDRSARPTAARTRVAHKTGNLGGIIHDVGIVYAPAAPFVIALLAEDAWDYREVAAAQAALTRAVYDYLQTAEAWRPQPPRRSRRQRPPCRPAPPHGAGSRPLPRSCCPQPACGDCRRPRARRAR